MLEFAWTAACCSRRHARAEGRHARGPPAAGAARPHSNREIRIAAIYRGGRSIDPEGDTTIEEHDEIFFIAAREDMKLVMKEFSSEQASVRRVVIAGAGNIGFRLAKALEDRVQVKLIERNPDRSRRAAETLRTRWS